MLVLTLTRIRILILILTLIYMHTYECTLTAAGAQRLHYTYTYMTYTYIICITHTYIIHAAGAQRLPQGARRAAAAKGVQLEIVSISTYIRMSMGIRRGKCTYDGKCGCEEL